MDGHCCLVQVKIPSIIIVLQPCGTGTEAAVNESFITALKYSEYNRIHNNYNTALAGTLTPVCSWFCNLP